MAQRQGPESTWRTDAGRCHHGMPSIEPPPAPHSIQHAGMLDVGIRPGFLSFNGPCSAVTSLHPHPPWILPIAQAAHPAIHVLPRTPSGCNLDRAQVRGCIVDVLPLRTVESLRQGRWKRAGVSRSEEGTWQAASAPPAACGRGPSRRKLTNGTPMAAIIWISCGLSSASREISVGCGGSGGPGPMLAWGPGGGTGGNGGGSGGPPSSAPTNVSSIGGGSGGSGGGGGERERLACGQWTRQRRSDRFCPPP